MAELRQCLRRGADKFPVKMGHRQLSERLVSRGKTAARAAFLPVGSVFDDRLNVVRSAADGAPAPQDGYTRLPASSRESRCCPGRREDGPSSGTRGNALQSGSRVRGWRTLCGSLSGGQLLCVRLYSGNGSGSEPLHKTKTGYYDILEVQPAATQAQIKTAYYKQSFIYHPDRNSGSDEATVRFSEISEAYTVLGNKGLRRKYDLGLLTLSDLTTTRRPSGKESSGRQQGQRTAVSAEQRGRIYDFDSFFKSHYSEQLQRQKDIRVRRQELQKKKDERLHEMSMDKMTGVGLIVMLVLALGLLTTTKER